MIVWKYELSCFLSTWITGLLFDGDIVLFVLQNKWPNGYLPLKNINCLDMSDNNTVSKTGLLYVLHQVGKTTFLLTCHQSMFCTKVVQNFYFNCNLLYFVPNWLVCYIILQ
jgi:hypothetical protein